MVNKFATFETRFYDLLDKLEELDLKIEKIKSAFPPMKKNELNIEDSCYT